MPEKKEKTVYERLKEALSGINVYGRTAEKMEAKPTEKKKPGTYTSAAEQDKMKKDLEDARERERMKKKPILKGIGK